MENSFIKPEWVPQVVQGSKILIVGASSGTGRAMVKLLGEGPNCTIGFHRGFSKLIPEEMAPKHNLIDLPGILQSNQDCEALVKEFVKKAGGIDALVVLCGGIKRFSHWNRLTEEEWKADIDLNLTIPFLLARSAMKEMVGAGGSIVLTGTESSLHGGSPMSFPYGVAKRGVECLVQGLAKEGAKFNILVNGIRMGFIKSGFHERWQGKTEKDLEERAKLIPLKRAGDPEEVAALFIFLLSGWSRFITGQMFAITGGGWL